MGRRRKQGFTLVELVITVAIIGLLLSLAAVSLIRGRRRISLERANVVVKGMVERARALAAVGGSRVGSNRLVYDASCTDASAVTPGDPTQWLLWVRFNGNAIEAPVRLLDQGNDTVTVSCETYDIAAATNNLAQVSAPAAPAALAFTPTGRMILGQGFAGPFAYIQFQDPTQIQRYGIRIFPSGVMCDASVAGGPPWCDQDPP